MSEFTVRDAVSWLGITWEAYVKATKTSAGRHGGPMVSALIEARDIHRSGANTSPEQVLARHGIDPADPAKAHRAFNTLRAICDATPKEFE